MHLSLVHSIEYVVFHFNHEIQVPRFRTQIDALLISFTISKAPTHPQIPAYVQSQVSYFLQEQRRFISVHLVLWILASDHHLGLRWYLWALEECSVRCLVIRRWIIGPHLASALADWTDRSFQDLFLDFYFQDRLYHLFDSSTWQSLILVYFSQVFLSCFSGFAPSLLFPLWRHGQKASYPRTLWSYCRPLRTQHS